MKTAVRSFCTQIKQFKTNETESFCPKHLGQRAIIRNIEENDNSSKLTNLHFFSSKIRSV